MIFEYIVENLNRCITAYKIRFVVAYKDIRFGYYAFFRKASDKIFENVI